MRPSPCERDRSALPGPLLFVRSVRLQADRRSPAKAGPYVQLETEAPARLTGVPVRRPYLSDLPRVEAVTARLASTPSGRACTRQVRHAERLRRRASAEAASMASDARRRQASPRVSQRPARIPAGRRSRRSPNLRGPSSRVSRHSRPTRAISSIRAVVMSSPPEASRSTSRKCHDPRYRYMARREVRRTRSPIRPRGSALSPARIIRIHGRLRTQPAASSRRLRSCGRRLVYAA